MPRYIKPSYNEKQAVAAAKWLLAHGATITTINAETVPGMLGLIAEAADDGDAECRAIIDMVPSASAASAAASVFVEPPAGRISKADNAILAGKAEKPPKVEKPKKLRGPGNIVLTEDEGREWLKGNLLDIDIQNVRTQTLKAMWGISRGQAWDPTRHHTGHGAGTRDKIIYYLVYIRAEGWDESKPIGRSRK